MVHKDPKLRPFQIILINFFNIYLKSDIYHLFPKV